MNCYRCNNNMVEVDSLCHTLIKGGVIKLFHCNICDSKASAVCNGNGEETEVNWREG